MEGSGIYHTWEAVLDTTKAACYIRIQDNSLSMARELNRNVSVQSDETE